MNTLPDLNDPEKVLEYLAEPIRAVRDGLDHGVSLADQKMSDMQWDSHLWAHLVRHGCRSYLRELPEVDGWRLGRELKNSGIEVVRGPIIFRALKSQAGTAPNPGSSVARRYFWSQIQLALPLQIDGVASPSDGANLILDWAIGAQRDVTLALSKPVGVWPYQGTPKLEWRRTVIVQDGAALRFDPAEEDVMVEPRFDLTEIEGDG
jgi:hypothetical protein